MSIWNCPVHGLYGGQVFCPRCGGGGEYVTLAASGMEAPSGGETPTEIEGSTEGDSPTGNAGDAQ